jgi:uncharacterized protein YceK
MRPALLLAACLGCLGSGCGTVVNLTAPPVSGRPDFVPTECSPFGGVTRSALLGVGSLGLGLLGIPKSGCAEELGGWAMWTGAGLVALVDTPLSLAGDVVTLPIAYARQQGAPWATWWGDQADSAKPEPGKKASVSETSTDTSEPTKSVGEATPSAPPPEAP